MIKGDFFLVTKFFPYKTRVGNKVLLCPDINFHGVGESGLVFLPGAGIEWVKIFDEYFKSCRAAYPRFK